MDMRSTAERRAAVLHRLRTDHNVWVATAGEDGIPHLVPVTLCWHRNELLLATRSDRALARDLKSSGRARLGLGDGDDVVLIDASAAVISWTSADPSRTAAFVRRAEWDPGAQTGDWLLLRLIPHRVRAWQSVEENIRGSVIMRDGQWIS